MRTCSDCSGSGIQTCIVCEGSGFCPMCDGLCHHCDGTGKYTCRTCNGTGDDGILPDEPEDDGD